MTLASASRGGWRHGLRHRLGYGWPPALAGERRRLWAHAASVGEMEGLVPLVRLWLERFPDADAVVSSLTHTGCETARRHLPGVAVRMLPVDLPWLARRVVDRVRPTVFLFTENELWPALLGCLARRRIPAVQVSGRLSPRHARLLARLTPLRRVTLDRVSRFCVQSQEVRDRLLALGVPEARVRVTGSLKSDVPGPVAPRFLEPVHRSGRPVLVVGSTHRGEEAAALDAMPMVERAFAHGAFGDIGAAPLWVFAPRHPERFAEVASLLERRGVSFLRRSQLPGESSVAANGPPPTAQGGDGAAAFGAVDDLARVSVLLLDGLGELASCYAGARAAFVGGSLVAVGGHNLLEPARCAVPAVVGPNLENVGRLATELADAGAIRIVERADDLGPALASVLQPEEQRRAGAAAQAIAARHGGTLLATWRAIEDLLGDPRQVRLSDRGEDSPVDPAWRSAPEGIG